MDSTLTTRALRVVRDLQAKHLAILLERKPRLNDAQMADMLGVSPGLVRKLRKRLAREREVAT